MNILLVSNSGEGAWFTWLLEHNGHKVSWVVGDDREADTLRGLIPPPLASIEHPSSYDLIVFDMTGTGDVADELRQHTPVIGCSELADKLEHDREFGIDFMQRAGITVPAWQAFDDVSDGLRWLRAKKKRVVFKPIGAGDDSSLTYVGKSVEDMERYLDILFRRVKVKRFLFQEFVEGTEVSTEAWFNGDQFFALNHTLEEKKFMAGGLGPNTGCAGNVVWMPPRSNALFERGLAKVAPLLKEAGYVGMVDLNTIVTEGEIYGLEWTPRFGYEGTCNLTRLLPMEFGEFMHTIAVGGTPTLGAARHPFAATIRVSIPPYPTFPLPQAMTKKFEGTPVSGIDPAKLDAWFLCGVRLREGSEEEIETCGDGFIGCPIGVGDSIRQAFSECEQAIGCLLLPNLQYRNDLRHCIEKRYETLLLQGWLRPTG